MGQSWFVPGGVCFLGCGGSKETRQDVLRQRYGASLSSRKLKLLESHNWVFKDRVVIPWGFFGPSVHHSHILYEDEDLLAVNKPPFISVVSSRGRPSLFSLWKSFRPEIKVVHRLDFETTGIVLFGKNMDGYRRLVEAFRRRQVQKRYTAWVVGSPRMEAWCVDEPILKRANRAVGSVSFGKAAHTDFRVLRRSGHGVSLVEAVPTTGRFHQIRCHLYLCGYPVVGEPLYGGKSAWRRVGVRLMLHSHQMVFVLNGKHYRIYCPVPSDFETRQRDHDNMPSGLKRGGQR